MEANLNVAIKTDLIEHIFIDNTNRFQILGGETETHFLNYHESIDESKSRDFE